MAAEKRDMDVVISSDSRKPITVFVPGIGEVEVNPNVVTESIEPDLIEETITIPIIPVVFKPEVIAPVEVIEPLVIDEPMVITPIEVIDEPVVITEPEVIAPVETVVPEFEEASQPELEPTVPVKRGRKPNVEQITS